MPAEYRTLWTTPGGGSGFSVLHYTAAGSAGVAQQIADDHAAYFLAVRGFYPDNVQLAFDSEVLDLDEAGGLTAVYAVTPPAAFIGINTSTFNKAAGLRVDWGTGQIVGGRRLTGRTYHVPCGSSVFDTDGSVSPANVTASQAAAAAFIAQTSLNRPLRVWSRKHAQSHVVTGASTPTKGAILRGRRD